MLPVHRPNLVDLILTPPYGQHLRLQRTLLAGFTSLGVFGVMATMHAAGMLGAEHFIQAGWAILIIFIVAMAMLLSGLNLRLPDPSMTSLQTLQASALLFWVAFHATPHGHAVVLLLVPLAFAYSSFRFGFATLLKLGAVLIVMALLEFAARQVFEAPYPLSMLEQSVHMAALVVSLLTLAIVGGQFNDLRRRNRAERAVSHIAMSGLSEAVLTVDRRGKIRFMNAAARQLFACKESNPAVPLLDEVCRFIDRAPLSDFLNAVTRRIETGGTPDAGFGSDHAEPGLDLTLSPATIASRVGDLPGSLDTDRRGLPLFRTQTGRRVPPSAPAFEPDIVGGMIERETGVYRYVRLSVSPLRNDRGVLEGFVLLVRDLSETHRLMNELKHAATHDPLTGLLNRRGYMATLQQTLNAARYDEQPGAALVIDLDQFKMVNDSCGHEAGDDLLRSIAGVLTALTPPGAALARIGGDEFGFVVRAMPMTQLQALAQRIILAIVDARFGREGLAFRIGASIGIARFSADCTDAPALMARADAACLLAKQRGRNQAQTYTPSNQELMRHKADMGWSQRIADALRYERFVLYLQRIEPARALDPAWDRFEVLLRMIGTDGSPIEPDAFLPAAERYSLIGAIDRKVVQMAVAALADIAGKGQRMPGLSINLSATSLRDASLLDWVRDTLRDYKVPGSQLTFELTETAAILDLDQALFFFAGLREMGCRIALDDVGSGFNSFSNLRRLPIDQIKIDGTYVRGAMVNPIDLVMVESIQRIAQVLQVETVAEFVESNELRALMASIAIDHLQGFAVHRPEPLAQVAERLPLAHAAV